MKLKLRLIAEWKHAWKFLSVQGMALAATIQVTWVSLPDDWKASVPHGWVAGLTIACLVFGTLGRVVDQGAKKDV